MEKDPKKIANELREDLTAYINLKSKILKLTTYEKTATITATITYGLVILILSLFAILFIFITLGLLIGQWINSTAGGFAIVSVLYLLIIILIFYNRTKWQSFIIEKILTVLTTNDSEDEQSNITQ